MNHPTTTITYKFVDSFFDSFTSRSTFFISVPLKQTKTSLHYDDWWISYFFLFVSLAKHHNQWQIHFTPCSFFWFTMALQTSLEETRQSNLIDSLDQFDRQIIFHWALSLGLSISEYIQYLWDPLVCLTFLMHCIFFMIGFSDLFHSKIKNASALFSLTNTF